MIVTKITDDEGDVNTRLSIASLLSSVGSLVGAPIAASLLDIEPPKYVRAQVFAGIFIALSVNDEIEALGDMEALYVGL
ncbi:hypothetical protein MARU1_002479 [Malassezia arunalokei]|uniref:Uncharacterized protein n=1 Tax=Malassezia arunalokei TaxID=1514897 RepID=A0AAJ5Z1X3_9BASI|nr:hypothetical protein MARU1_002479 [Malassezia arunalokei]